MNSKLISIGALINFAFRAKGGRVNRRGAHTPQRVKKPIGV